MNSSGAIFLSYAREDATPARRIAEALRATGVEVWFDEDELVGGDAWDAKIKQQIRDCALFMPIISANTQARREGYFRIEWKLAAQRTHAIAEGTPFLLPVVIDSTAERGALVPGEFREVQWTRLSGGEPFLQFCTTVQNLLAGDLGPRPSPVASETQRPGTAAVPGTRPGPRATRWLVAAAILSAVGLGVWQTWRKNSGTPPKSAAAAPASEGRKLAAKADALFDQDDRTTRDTVVLAEKLCQQALALDPNDAEVWAVYSRVGSFLVYMTYDRSQERRRQASEAANTAVRLAPTSYEARFALACFYRLDDTTYREAERILRALLEERPGDKRVWRTLGRTLLWSSVFFSKSRGREQEAIDALRRAAALPGGDPMALVLVGTVLASLGQLGEAEKAVDESIALKPDGPGYGNKMNVMLRYVGNVARAREALAHVPIEQMRQDRDAYIAWEIWLCSREPDKAIEVLKPLPRDYLEAAIDAPKGLLVAQAHRLAGRPDAANIEARAALQVVDRRLTSEPNNVRLLVWRAWLLAQLGDSTEARRLLQTTRQLGLSARDAHAAANVAIALADLTGAVELLGAALTERLVVTRAFLRIHPAWDALRGDPRFQALVAEPSKTENGAKPNDKSIAVLAFQASRQDVESEIFSDGISEEVSNVLAKIPGLRVAARASAFYFKGKTATAQEMGQKLNVAYLVDGSVQRDGNQVRVTARLSRADTGEQVWSDKFDRELKNIFALQDDIAGRIADNLKLKLGYAPRTTRVVNPEAYRLLLEGRHFWNLRSLEGFAQAESAITQALALDPNFAEAHAALADVYNIRATYALQDGRIERVAPEEIARARAEAQRALELDPTLTDAYPALAYGAFLEMRFAEAEQEFQKALALNPNNAVAHAWHATLLLSQGKLEDGIKRYEQADLLDPLWSVNLTILGEVLNYARQYEAALAVSDRALALRPDYVPNLGNRARTLFAMGRKTEAVAAAREVRRLLDKTPRRDADGSAMWVLQQAGFAEEAAAYGETVLRTLTESSQQRGFVLGALGRFDDALPFLERTPPVARRRLFWDPMWDRWRDDPRFTRLMEKLGCLEEYRVARRTLEQLSPAQPSTKK